MHMAEMIGGDIGTQILNAVQGLGVRMDRLETQVADLRMQVTLLDSRMMRQERETQQLRGDVQRLGGDVQTLSGKVQHLRGDFQQLLADMQEGFRRLNARDELTASTVVLMASVLRRPTDLGEELENRLRELQRH